MVDTALLGILLITENQNDAEVVANDASDAFDAAIGLAARGNRIINSSLISWQEGVTFTGISANTYFADLFQWNHTGAGVVDVLRSTDTPDVSMPFSIHVDVTTADVSIASGDFYALHYGVEGLDIREALLGVAAARPLHLSFWVKADVTGIYSVRFGNSADNRRYVVEYTVDVTDTWERKQIQLTGDLTGTWLADTGLGLRVSWTLAAGTTNHAAANDTWAAGSHLASSGQVNALSDAANNWRMTNPQLYVGRVPSTADGLALADREVTLEERKIRRLFERIDTEVASQQFGMGQCLTTTTAIVPISYVPKRIIPTITVSAAGDFAVEQDDGTDEAVTVLTGAVIGLSRAEMAVTTAANLLAGDATILRDDGGDSAFIDIDARL